MGNLICTKKGKASVILLVISGLFLFMALFFFINTIDILGRDDGLELVLSVITPMLCLGAGVMCLLQYLSENKSYISIYNDSIEGIGVNGISKSESFRYRNGEYTVTQQDSIVNINTAGKKLRLRFSKEEAAQVYQLLTNRHSHSSANPYSQPKANPTNQANAPKAAANQGNPGKVIRPCPNCGAKCLVPAGKGHVKITCPKCQHQFNEVT